MPSHFDDFGVSAGNSSRGEERADLPAGRGVDHAERNLLVVSHQEQPAVADRLDGRGLQHVVQAIGRVAPIPSPRRTAREVVTGSTTMSSADLLRRKSTSRSARRPATRSRCLVRDGISTTFSLPVHLRSMSYSVFPSTTSTETIESLAFFLFVGSGILGRRPDGAVADLHPVDPGDGAVTLLEGGAARMSHPGRCWPLASRPNPPARR